jgi:hypothetical protein
MTIVAGFLRLVHGPVLIVLTLAAAICFICQRKRIRHSHSAWHILAALLGFFVTNEEHLVEIFHLERLF